MTSETVSKTFLRSGWDKSSSYKWGLFVIWSLRYQYFNSDMKVDYCRMLDKLFNHPSTEHVRNSLDWVLSYINQFKGKKSSLT